MNTYGARRAEFVAMLRRVEPADWERSGVHEEQGPVTLRSLIAFLVAHEEEHCAQLEELG